MGEVHLYLALWWFGQEMRLLSFIYKTFRSAEDGDIFIHRVHSISTLQGYLGHKNSLPPMTLS